MTSKRCLPLAILLGAVVASSPWLVAARAVGPDITAVDPYSWQANGSSPAMVTVMSGEEVKFSYPSGESHHYPVFHSGPEGAPPPACAKLPTTLEAGAPGWSGSCTFSQAGTYVFYCGVHGALMTATITVTNPGEPTASSEAVTEISETSATLNGTVNPGGKETSYHFRYGLTTSYENPPTPTHTLTAGSIAKAVSEEVSGLTPGRTYHFQLVAENTSGTVHSADRTFTTTSPPGPPSATTGTASALSETGATLKGTVNPDGRPTEYFFEWGTSDTYGQVTPSVSVGEDHVGHTASSTLSSLTPGTVYHFRLVARNTSSEVVSGADQTFMTSSLPLTPQPPATQTTQPSTTTPPISLASKPKEVSLLGSPSLVKSSLKLTGAHHGSSVRGSIEIGQAGIGGRLQVDLFAKRTVLTKTRSSGSKTVRIGRLVRQPVPAGKLSLSLALTTQGKRALARRHSLPVTVTITLTPTQGKATTITRSVTLHA